MIRTIGEERADNQRRGSGQSEEIGWTIGGERPDIGGEWADNRRKVGG
jgi:hypothetical protein